MYVIAYKPPWLLPAKQVDILDADTNLFVGHAFSESLSEQHWCHKVEIDRHLPLLRVPCNSKVACQSRCLSLIALVKFNCLLNRLLQ